MDIQHPYLLFLGDAHDQLAAKTAQGVAEWRPEWSLGQFRLPGCQADLGLPDLSIEEAAAKGAKTLVLGVANRGGVIAENWIAVILDALDHGMDVAAGLHNRLTDIPQVAAKAKELGRDLFDVRYSPPGLPLANGKKRSGLRLLTVGTDCSVGKKYTVLALEKAMQARGMKADMCATGQTGVLIAGHGMALDAVIADFLSGAAETLSPDNEPDHWDLIEGQGSLFHPSFAGVTLGLIHGSQPDALVLCHEPTRRHMRGLPDYPIPDMKLCLEANLTAARLTNPAVKAVGVSVNTKALDEAGARAALAEAADKTGLPAADPLRFGCDELVEVLEAWK